MSRHSAHEGQTGLLTDATQQLLDLGSGQTLAVRGRKQALLVVWG
jgi:hypothetical protein